MLQNTWYTMDHDVAKGAHYGVTMINGIAMSTYHGITIRNDVENIL